MKTKKKFYYIAKIISLVLFINLSACTGDFEEINTPPSSSITTDPGYLFTGAQISIRREVGESQNNIFGSWVQHWCGGPLFSASLYIPDPERLQTYWNGYYGSLKNLGLIKNDILTGLEDDPEGRTKIAMAKILEVYYWQILTDMFGPIPYSESMLPLADLIRQPKYDSQESIYRSLITDLDAAIAKLNASDKSYGSADMFYGGNVDAWKKFGNSLKLRLGMRIKYGDASLAQSTVEGALSSSLISSNADNAYLPTANDRRSNKHPTLGQAEQGSSDYFYLAEKIVDVLLAMDDPRLPLLGDTTAATAGTPGAEFKGVKVAQLDNYYASIIRAEYSQISGITYFNEVRTIPVYAFSYAEVCFFKAEAALEGWGGLSDTDAENFYQEGIKAAMSMEPYNIAETDIPPAYIASEFSLAGLTKEEKLEKIMTQKWISLFGRNFESWFEWRRTGYPVLVPGPSGEGKIPRRALYPIDETTFNKENYDAAAAAIGGDSYQSKVWWDKK